MRNVLNVTRYARVCWFEGMICILMDTPKCKIENIRACSHPPTHPLLGLLGVAGGLQALGAPNTCMSSARSPKVLKGAPGSVCLEETHTLPSQLPGAFILVPSYFIFS